MDRSAYIMSQVVMMQAELAAMQAANAHRADQGFAQAYGEEAFDELFDRL